MCQFIKGDNVLPINFWTEVGRKYHLRFKIKHRGQKIKYLYHIESKVFNSKIKPRAHNQHSKIMKIP
jgi:hypothetical protein